MRTLSEARRIQAENAITLPADVEALIARIEAAPSNEARFPMLDEMDGLKAKHGFSRYSERAGGTTYSAQYHLIWAITSSLCGQDEEAEVGLAWLRDRVAGLVG